MAYFNSLSESFTDHASPFLFSNSPHLDEVPRSAILLLSSLYPSLSSSVNPTELFQRFSFQVPGDKFRSIINSEHLALTFDRILLRTDATEWALLLSMPTKFSFFLFNTLSYTHNCTYLASHALKLAVLLVSFYPPGPHFAASGYLYIHQNCPKYRIMWRTLACRARLLLLAAFNEKTCCRSVVIAYTERSLVKS